MSKVLRLRTDGAARNNPGPAGAGFLIEDDQGMRLRACHKWLGHKTNNQAEYLALIEGLKSIAEWKPDRLEIFMDSKLVVEQVKGKWKVKEPELKQLHGEVLELLRAFPDYHIQNLPREDNRAADALANMAIDEHVKGRQESG